MVRVAASNLILVPFGAEVSKVLGAKYSFYQNLIQIKCKYTER